MKYIKNIFRREIYFEKIVETNEIYKKYISERNMVRKKL
jgi:hypothetical protein